MKNDIDNFSTEFDGTIVKISEVHKGSVERLGNLGDGIFR